MEGEAQVRLVFAGEVLAGCQVDEVKRRFGEAFKVEGARLDAMFSGERQVLKRALPVSEATRYVAKLGKLGARVHMEPLEPAPATPASRPAPSAQPVAPVPPATAAPLTLASASAATEEEIVCPTCGERQSKRVFCRSCTTDMPRGIAARKEDAERARAERLDASRDRSGGRWAPPRSAGSEVSAGGVVDAPPMLSLSFEGRMGRVSYLNAGALAWVGLACIGIGAAVLLPIFRSFLMLIPLGLAFVVFLIWALRITVLRLHDFNFSGWWVLVTFVPYVGALASLALLAVPGTPDDNDHGERPRQGNGMVAAVVVIVSVIALLAIGRLSMKSYDQYRERSLRAEQQQHDDEDDAPADSSDAGATRRAARYLRTPAAVDAFSTYGRAPNGKAFATSGGGAFGWSSGHNSQREAITQALASCDSNREPYTAACRVVNVDGAWPKQR